MEKIVKFLRHINLKSIYFNFKYFKFKDALRFPVFVSSYVKIHNLKGSVLIDSEIHTGMIKIGYDFVGIYDKKYCRAVWNNHGLLVFKGRANIKHGAKISIEKGAVLTIGDNFRIACNSSIVCAKEITFGCGCRVSWESIIIDTDFHSIYSLLENEKLNINKPIVIGNNVWIGMHCKLMKGTGIGNDCVLAANSLTNKIVIGSNQLLAGSPAKVVRNNIYWND